MTRDEWFACSDPQVLLDFLRDSGKLSERKARLLAVAACRRVWPLLKDYRSRQTATVLERYADGQAGPEELAVAALAAEAVFGEEPCDRGPCPDVSLNAVFADLPDADSRLDGEEKNTPLDPISNAQNAVYAAKFARCADPRVQAWTQVDAASIRTEEEYYSQLVRCVAGNPFQATPALDPATLTPNIVGLATTIYGDRSWDRLADLAALLEAAGCTDAPLLEHLRGPGPHTRGCFALDAVLGKE